MMRLAGRLSLAVCLGCVWMGCASSPSSHSDGSARHMTEGPSTPGSVPIPPPPPDAGPPALPDAAVAPSPPELPDASVAPSPPEQPDASVAPSPPDAAPARDVGPLLPKAAPCTLDSQCASGYCGAKAPGKACGLCIEPRELGESCGRPFEDCRPGADCVDGVCVKGKKLLGEACQADPKGGESADCAEPFFCEQDPAPNTSLYAGHCAERKKEGESCGPHALCERELACQRPTTAADQSTCVRVPAASCSLGCPVNTYCNPDTLLCQAGTLTRGARCNVSGQSNLCAPGLACENQPVGSQGSSTTFAEICFPLPLEGETCFGYSCGVGLFCHVAVMDGGLWTTCLRARREHESCGLDRAGTVDCADGLICRAHSCEKPCS